MGMDTLQIGDSSTVLTSTNDSDWVDFVLEILGSEAYQAKIKVSGAVEGSKICILVNENIQDTIAVEAGSDTIQAPIYLHKGKHTLKLIFSNDELEANLMDIDWIDLYGEASYYSITASASEGGSIEPEGLVYVAKEDSIEFIRPFGS